MSLNIFSRLFTLNSDATPEKEFHTVQALDALLNGTVVDFEEPGNVINFGADITGVADSTTAFQDAINSDYAVYVPYGEWRIDGQLVIDQYEKVIQCQRGMVPNYRWWNVPDQVAWNPAQGSRVHIFKDGASTNGHFIKIRAGGVAILGFPTFDVSLDIDYVGAAIFYACNESNGLAVSAFKQLRGWGGFIEIMVMNDPDLASNVSAGINAIECAWDSPTMQSAYLTMMEWKVYGHCVRYGLYLPALDPTGNQFSNSLHAILQIDGCKQAVYNYCFNSSRFDGIIQARNLVDVTEVPKAVVDSSAGGCTYDIHPYDLNSDVDGDGHYRMSTFMVNQGMLNHYINRSSYVWRETNVVLPNPRESLYAPMGFIPYLAQGYSPGVNGMNISRFHNNLSNIPQKEPSWTYASYNGEEVSDFATLTDDSVTEGITPNTEITFTDMDYLTADFGGYPRVSCSADAVTDEDYVELYFPTYSYRALHMFFSFTSNGGWSQIQVIRKINSVITDNVIIDIPRQNDEHPVASFRMTLSGDLANETIIRFIANRDSGKTCVFQDLASFHNENTNQGPMITTQGGKAIYGYLFMDGHLRTRNATTAELTDVSDPVNTEEGKQEGSIIFNSDTDKPVWASGSADNSGWVDATGATVHTPV